MTNTMNAFLNYCLQSAATNIVKMFALNGSTPRSPLSSGPLSTFFPQSSKIPQPLTAAMGSYSPARAFFFGGNPRTAFTYSYNAATVTFTAIGNNSGVANAWSSDIQAAAMFYVVTNGSSLLYAFNDTSALQVNANLAVSQSLIHVLHINLFRSQGVQFLL